MSQENALLVPSLVSDDNNCKQRQAANNQAKLDPLSTSNDAFPSPNSSILHDRPKIATNNTNKQRKLQQSLSTDQISSGKRSQFESEKKDTFAIEKFAEATTTSELASSEQILDSDLSGKQSRSNTQLSAWHNSLSRMSTSRLSFFASAKTNNKKQQSASSNANFNESKLNSKSQLISQLEINEQEPQMSVAESMRIGLDTWIECKLAVSFVKTKNITLLSNVFQIIALALDAWG